MISTTLFTTAALALASNLLVNAVVIPRDLDDDDFSVKIVETITCTPLDGYTGTLTIKNTENTATNGDVALPDGGVPLGIFGTALGENAGDAQYFQFQNCTSTFMAMPQTDGVYYGHIVPVADTSSCLAVFPSQPEAQSVLKDRCSTSDDSGQMLLFWKLTVNTADASAPATIDFVGRSTKLGPDGIYLTQFTGTEPSRSVKLQHTDDHDKVSSYQLDLVPSAAPAPSTTSSA